LKYLIDLKIALDNFLSLSIHKKKCKNRLLDFGIMTLIGLLLMLAIYIGGCNGRSSYNEVYGDLRWHDREIVTRGITHLKATIKEANEHLGEKVLLEGNIVEALCSMALHGDFPQPRPLPSV
jgi:hypothetical protein